MPKKLSPYGKQYRKYPEWKKEELRAQRREIIRKKREENPDYDTAYTIKQQYTGEVKRKREIKEKRRIQYFKNIKLIHEYNGELYYSIHVTSRKTGLAPRTIRMYIYWGIIPTPIYIADCLVKNPKGNYKARYFSETQIQLIKKAFRKHKGWSRKKASRYLHDNWTKYEKNLGDQGHDRSID